MKFVPVRGCSQDENGDVIAARVFDQCACDVARFEHVMRHLMIGEIDAAHPLPLSLKVLAVDAGLAPVVVGVARV